MQNASFEAIPLSVLSHENSDDISEKVFLIEITISEENAGYKKEFYKKDGKLVSFASRRIASNKILQLRENFAKDGSFETPVFKTDFEKIGNFLNRNPRN